MWHILPNGKREGGLDNSKTYFDEAFMSHLPAFHPFQRHLSLQSFFGLWEWPQNTNGLIEIDVRWRRSWTICFGVEKFSQVWTNVHCGIEDCFFLQICFLYSGVTLRMVSRYVEVGKKKENWVALVLNWVALVLIHQDSGLKHLVVWRRW